MVITLSFCDLCTTSRFDSPTKHCCHVEAQLCENAPVIHLNDFGSDQEQYSDWHVTTEKKTLTHAKGWPYLVSKRPSLPHNYLHHSHSRLIQGIKEVHQGATTFTHLSNDRPKHQAKDNEAQDVYPIKV